MAERAGQNRYDVVIIGSGPGGYVAAVRAAQVGLKTAIVEKAPRFGGTCTWTGCIPTKALLENAAVYDQTLRAKEFGVGTGDVTLNLASAMDRKTKIVRKMGKAVENLLKANRVDIFQGHGRLAGKGKVSVTGDGGEVSTLETANALIATGSAARSLPALKVDGRRVVTSDEILDAKEIPRHLVVLGAGAVGVEFASIFRRFGSKVTLVEMLPRIVPLEDEEVSAELAKSLRKQGMTIHTGVTAGDFRVTSDGVVFGVTGPAQGGAPATIEGDTLLVAVGRRPLTDDIGLTGTQAKTDKGYIQVDGYMRTGEPGVYAIGDVVATPLLAHVASAEGILAVEHMAGREVHPINYDHVPAATYCEPEVASIGLTEAAARQRGHEVKVGKFPFTHNSKAPILGHTEGFVKMVAEARYGELLGVHIVGPRATEMIAEAGVALRTEATVEEMYRTIHPHPTLSEAMLEAARGVFGRAIHS